MSTLSELMEQLKAVQEVDAAMRRQRLDGPASGWGHSGADQAGEIHPARETFHDFLQSFLAEQVVAEATKALTAAVDADSVAEAKLALAALRACGCIGEPTCVVSGSLLPVCPRAFVDMGPPRLSLVELIRARAALPDIETALSCGESPDDIEVIQELEGALRTDESWTASILALPAFSDAWQRREDADQAAFDAMDAIENNDAVSLSEAIGIMKEAGDTADMSIDDDSFLASAVRWRCGFDIFEILLSEGEADPTDFSEDAWDLLREQPDDAWRAHVEALFRSAAGQNVEGGRKVGNGGCEDGEASANS
jgi:hypothetical protein